MPLFVKDPVIDEMVDRLAAATGRTKTAVVRDALERECRRVEDDDFVERVVAFARDFRAGHSMNGPPADKDFIDSLYE